MKATIEIPKGSIYKYEIDKKSGKLFIDRPLSIQVPFNYGYINDTLAPDGDALDIFIISKESIPPCTELEFEIMSVMICKDDGILDEKIIAFTKGDRLNCFNTIDIREAVDQIRDYLEKYKKKFEVIEYKNSKVAASLIEKYRKVYENK